jgi:hypothetical protein
MLASVVDKRVIAAALAIAVGIVAIVAYRQKDGRSPEQCEAEAERAVSKLQDRESIYGTAVLTDGADVMMRDRAGKIHRVDEDVFARQLGAGWRQATREDVRAGHVAACLDE